MIWPFLAIWRRCATFLRGPQSAPTGSDNEDAQEPVGKDDSAEVPMLFQPDPRHKLMADSLVIARSQVGVREVPRNSNRGPEVEEYQAAVGIAPGKPYCTALAYWAVEKAWREMNSGWDEQEGAPPVPLLKTGWSHAMWEWLEEKGQSYTVEQVIRHQAIPPGALFFMWGRVSWGNGQGVHHVGLVEGIDLLEGSIFTCEGNTDGSGTNEGGGVYRLERPLESIYRFAVY